MTRKFFPPRRDLISRISSTLGTFPTSQFLALIDGHHPIGPDKYQSVYWSNGFDRRIEVTSRSIAAYHTVMLELIERSFNTISKGAFPTK